MLSALVAKWNAVATERTVHHPEAPAELEESVARLKRFTEKLLGYEPPVVVEKLEDRWLIDVSRRGIASSFSDLRTFVASTDRDLSYRNPSFDWEFRIEGRRYPELVQDRPFSRTRFHFESPRMELREVVFRCENALRARFGEEPYLSVYERESGRFEIHASLGDTERQSALEGRLRSFAEMIRKENPLLDFTLFVDRKPLDDGRRLTKPREETIDLSLSHFDPSFRTP